jgi:tetratricopeptide (TPR) repeat protein
MRSFRKFAALGVVAALVIGLTALASMRLSHSFRPEANSGPVAGTGVDRVTGRNIAGLQQHLREQPRDATGWAALGLAYVEQARVTADPSYYPKAAGVLDRSLRVQPKDNEAALTGQGALAAARHDFAGALRLAEQALKVNPYGMRAQAVRVDALVELGRYDEADRAVRHADATKPGIPIFTRYAYVMELRGHPDQAERVLRQAATSANDPADVAYVHIQLGELAWNHGDLKAADREYATALRVDPNSLPALDGRARVRAARGDQASALQDRKALVGKAPLPAYVVALGELYDSQRLPDQARTQYAVAGSWARLAQANGVATTDLEGSLIASDHGDRRAALQAARAEWSRRQSIHVADALAWALHVNGKDREALGYARQASRTGYRNALFLYHQGMIEKALRMPEAKRDLKASLDLNPHFSDLHAPLARKALKELS